MEFIEEPLAMWNPFGELDLCGISWGRDTAERYHAHEGGAAHSTSFQFPACNILG